MPAPLQIVVPARRLAAAVGLVALLTGGQVRAAEPAMKSAVRGADPAGLAEIVARYVAWRGGAAFEALNAVHWSADVSRTATDGESGQIDIRQETWGTRDQRARVQVSWSGVLTSLAGSSAAGAWSLGGQDDATQPPTAARRSEALIELGDALATRDGAKIALAPSVTRDGRDWAVVRVTFRDGSGYDAFIDPETGALDGILGLGDSTAALERFSDWRLVDGVRMPFLVTGVTADTSTQWRTTELDLNPSVPASLFQRPSHDPIRAHGPSGPTSWVSFTYQDDEITLPVTINGRAETAQLDNGAWVTNIDGNFARSVGMPTTGAFENHGVSGTETTPAVGPVTVTVGAVSLTMPSLATTNIGWDAASDTGNAAIVGDELFNSHVVGVDFARRRLTLSDPASFTPPAGAVELPLTDDTQMRVIPAAVEGRGRALFELDLGDDGTLDLSPDYAHQIGLLDGRPVTQRFVSGVGGEQPVTITSVQSLGLANVTLHDIPTSVHKVWPKETFAKDVIGALGLGLMDRFQMILDYPHSRLYLLPNADAETAAFERDGLGIWSLPQGKTVLVTYVAPHSPAETAGFKAGDRIVAVNGQAMPDGWTTLISGPFGKVFKVTLEGGAEKTVTLARYY